jgi:hypothetical protein
MRVTPVIYPCNRVAGLTYTRHRGIGYVLDGQAKRGDLSSMPKTQRMSTRLVRPYDGTAVIDGEMRDIQFLKGRYPSLNPSLIAEVVHSHGPGRARIETELWRLSNVHPDK